MSNFTFSASAFFEMHRFGLLVSLSRQFVKKLIRGGGFCEKLLNSDLENFKVGKFKMAKRCQVTGKKPMVGNNVSHANNKTKRRFLPNLHKKRFFVPSENRWIRIKVSARGIKTITKKGIDVVIKEMRERGEKI